MKNFTMRWKMWFFAAISFFFFINTFSQTVGETLDLAKIAFEKQDYEKCILLIDRVSYFSNDSLETEYRYLLADVYFVKNDYVNSYKHYQKCLNATPNDDAKLEIQFKALASLVLGERESEALEYANQITIKTGDTLARKRITLYKGAVFFRLMEYDSAETNFASNSNPLQSIRIRNLIKKHKKVEALSARKAQNLSFLLPGLGQLYTKDYINAANSFLLNTGLISLGVISAITYTPWDAILWVGPWWVRYYLGGSAKAGMSIEKIKKTRNDRVLNEIFKCCGNSSLF